MSARVETTPHLSRPNPANQTVKHPETKAAEANFKQTPPESLVTKWLAQAKELPRMITY